jgi:Family of unknown function (DUF6058)
MDTSPRADLAAAVSARFYAVNGEHEMTAADDDYVTAWFATVEDVAARAGRSADELRMLMLRDRLPLPSYIRSDGAQMVFRDVLGLIEAAGDVDAVPAWFAGHFSSPAEAVAEWDAYLSGQYVCLRSATPVNIQRKSELTAAIEALLAQPEPASDAWLVELHGLVDALDEIEPPFAPYDRLRFGGPISRDRLIADVRERFSSTGPSQAAAENHPEAVS